MSLETVKYEGQAALEKLKLLEGTVIGMQHRTASESNDAVVFRDTINGGISLAYLCQCDPEHCNEMAGIHPLVGSSSPVLEEKAEGYVLIYFASQSGLPGSYLEEYRSLLERDS
ncbi:hypothetical protein CL619_02455 [archaeon]|nr:hypothetical protein [archaeon]|tara:strand:- start:43 stop:384 length:342 start_codon:yes stop_codon:yes gene_type:complete